MKAKKENKVYLINNEQEKQRYLKEGYDIYDDEGNVLEHSPQKKIAYGEYVKAVKEIGRLQALCAEHHSEIEGLKAENESLKAKAEPLKATAEEKKEKAAKKEGE